MRLAYLLLSATWGMHQYTADLANRMAAAGHQVHLISSRHHPADRYSPAIQLHTPVSGRDRGLSASGLRLDGLIRILRTLRAVRPEVVHLTGPHLWNPLLLAWLRQQGIPSLHTLHDLHPHAGARYGRTLYLWNRWVAQAADHLLVHGKRYCRELIDGGLRSDRVTHTPLTHLFLSHQSEAALRAARPEVRHEPWALFFGRLEHYKGLSVLIEAARRLGPNLGVVAVGPGEPDRQLAARVPNSMQLESRLVGDKEAIDLFSRCGLVVLPYIEASQSALVAAAYTFSKPMIVTRVGALPEYVTEDETGWVVPPEDPAALARTLETALSDPGRLARMGAAGRRLVDGWREADRATLLALYQQLRSSQVLPSGG